MCLRVAIVGSAMLYRDFDNISAHRFIVFLYGCITTFLGVLLLTGASFPSFSTPPPTPSEPGTPSSIHPSLSAGATDATPLLVRIVPSSPNLRNRASTASLGLSPAHYLLLATSAGSPPRVLGEVNGSGNALQFPRPRSASATSDREAAVGSPGRIGLPPTLGRRFGSTASAPTEPPRDREA